VSGQIRQDIGKCHSESFRDAPPTGSDDDGNEALLTRKLRSCASFVPELDYVAELDGSVIGNIMYARSKVIGDDCEWETLTFGPVSVLPKYQRDGVGSALIRKTLDVARDLGYRAVLIFGHESYYPRFGFKPASTQRGENLIHFAAQKYHIGIYPGAEAMEYFKPRLAKYKTSKGQIIDQELLLVRFVPMVK